MITKIAIVDDHELMCKGLMGIINGFENYDVCLTANNGKDFINKITSSPIPDIVVLDITMPVMDGYETAEWIASHLSGTKILALSMLDDDKSIIKMLRNGAVGYLLKDSNPVLLKKGIDSIRDNGYFYNDIVNEKMLRLYKNGIDGNSNNHITTNELEFLRYAASDLTYREIASKMNLSPRTIDNYRDSMFVKFGVKSRVGLVLFAINNGLINIKALQ